MSGTGDDPSTGASQSASTSPAGADVCDLESDEPPGVDSNQSVENDSFEIPPSQNYSSRTLRASQSANATSTASPVVPDTQADHDETSSRDIEQPLANAKSSEIDIEVNKIE